MAQKRKLVWAQEINLVLRSMARILLGYLNVQSSLWVIIIISPTEEMGYEQWMLHFNALQL